MTYTYTYAILDVLPAAYHEIRAKLAAAGYQHAFHQNQDGEVIDMHGIALRESTLEERLAAPIECAADLLSRVEFQALKAADAGSATALLARFEAEDHPRRVMDEALDEDRRRQEEADLRYQQQQAQ